jgi:ribosome-associated protein
MSTRTPKTSKSKLSLHQELFQVLEDGKGEDVVVIDLAGKTDIADHMVIASGTSSRHVSSLADKVMDHLKELGGNQPSVEGLREGQWVLVDADTVLVHIFMPDVRATYDLEKMWSVALPQAQSF